MTLFKGALVLILTALIFGACSQKTAAPYDSASDLAQALVKEDAGCDQLETGSSEAELVKEQGTCEVQGQKLEIFLFDDAEQRDSWLEFGGRLRPATATGPNWAIIGAKAPVEAAAEALGADLRE